MKQYRLQVKGLSPLQAFEGFSIACRQEWVDKQEVEELLFPMPIQLIRFLILEFAFCSQFFPFSQENL